MDVITTTTSTDNSSNTSTGMILRLLEVGVIFEYLHTDLLYNIGDPIQCNKTLLTYKEYIYKLLLLMIHTRVHTTATIGIVVN